MPKRIVVGLTVCLVLVSLGVAIAGLRLIVAKSALGYVLTLAGFLSLLVVPILAGRLSGGSQGPTS